MKKSLFTIFNVLMFLSLPVLAMDTPEEQNINLTLKKATLTKIDENFYVGKRAQDTDLHFGMRRLTDDNFPLWRKFETGQNDACLRIWEEMAPDGFKDDDDFLPQKTQDFLMFINVTRPSGKATIEAGRMAFRESLDIYESYKPEIWITYALAGDQIDPTQPISEKMFPNIEMVLTVSTHSDAPFTTHMGIARTVYFEEKAFKNELWRHPNLSNKLHEVSAQFMQWLNPQKIWGLTCPTFNMGAIFDKSLPQGSYLKGREQVPTGLRETEHELLVYNHDGDCVASFPLNEIKKDNSWQWYFSHAYLCGQGLPQYLIKLDVLASLFDQ